MNYKAYLIHYTQDPDRLAHMRTVFAGLEVEYEVISDWDRESIGEVPDNRRLWDKGIYCISDILIANATSVRYSSYIEALAASARCSVTDFEWLKSRELKAGEVSVLLKHRQAIERIAFGKELFGLIFEDDIFLIKDSNERLRVLISEWVALNGQYLDIAGGAGLLADKPMSRDSALAICRPPRTRTNACYAITRELARRLLSEFYPLIFPIDWHLQYIFNEIQLEKCYWASPPPLIHGSEQGLIKSWRNNV
jgi:GR25 family glycosyltransferase involved in LPS biosynthesis